jgi:hypothetical protein
MYAIHTTPGFIIDSRPSGEAGKLLMIFTRDFGLVMASAQGIRFEKSKLRYYTQDYSFGAYSLVRGKEFWRLTSAAAYPAGAPDSSRQLLENDGKSVTFENQLGSMLVARIALLLKRFLQGEEPNIDLYDCVEGSIGFLLANPKLDSRLLGAFESLAVLKILDALGYIGSDPVLDGLVTIGISIPALEAAAVQKAAINRHINKALKESHL